MSANGPFVGRDDQLGELLAAARTPPALVCVEGEAGAGKSRLIRELAERTSARTLIGSCPALHRPLPLETFAGLIRATGRTPPRREISAVLDELLSMEPDVLVIEDV